MTMIINHCFKYIIYNESIVVKSNEMWDFENKYVFNYHAVAHCITILYFIVNQIYAFIYLILVKL